MKSCVFFILCILAFVSPQDAGHMTPRSNSAINSRTKTTPGHTTVSSSGKVPTSYRSQRVPPSHTIVSKSSVKAPTVYPTASPKTTVRPTIGTTSQKKPKSPSSRGSDSEPSRTAKSSPPPATTTTTNPTTRNPTITPTVVSASKTLTVSNGQTVSAQVGWMVVGVGVGGAVAVGGNILPVAGGTEAIIEENSSGQDELSTIESDTTTTTSSTSTSKSSSTSSSTSRSSSSSTSSSRASPTPYNIYPRLDSTPPQQSAFAQHLQQIAQPGTVRSITGVRDRLLL